MNFVETAIGDADVILYVTDVVEKSTKNEEYIEKLNRVSSPVILVINKIDLSNQTELETLYEKWREFQELRFSRSQHRRNSMCHLF